MTLSTAEPATGADQEPPTAAGRKARWLGALGKALDWRIQRLQREYLAESSSARADLARLRRGLGKPAGSVPEIWELTVVPDALTWDRDEPSRAEQAAHAAMTLYALHQQSLTVGIHEPNVRFGAAVRRLAGGGRKGDEKSGKQGGGREDARSQAVTRRFMAVATAQSIDEVLFHVRGLITQLRREKIGLDYAIFADDVLNLLTPGRETLVRLAWGRDFYRTHLGDGAKDTSDASDADFTTQSDDNE
jgi:CRISPR system Cascade subunit CasB